MSIALRTRGKAGHRRNSVSLQPSKSTLWRRARGRPTLKDKAIRQQYLTPCEEETLVRYVLEYAERGYPLPVKSLRSLALVIARRRGSNDPDLHLPGKNWPQGFYKRHPILKAKTVKALDRARHDDNIYGKIVDWFTLMGRELHEGIQPKNVYNMDETGILLSHLTSRKVLVSSHDLRRYRGAAVNRTLITAIECIAADGSYLVPLIVWPSATTRSNWYTHPTPHWRFACSKTGYTNAEISLHWIQQVFDPLTKRRAGGQPRILINDGLATHESLEVLTFCHENNIILCRLPSHTSHKLQPCDVGVFGPLKTAYREQVEQLFRGGANTVGKQHFTLLYDRARTTAFTPENIKSAWRKAGLFPFDPDRVLRGMRHPSTGMLTVPSASAARSAPVSSLVEDIPLTPTTSEALTWMRMKVEQDLASAGTSSTQRLQKIIKGFQSTLAHCAVLSAENQWLMEQNNEKTSRASVRSTVVGGPKVMTYDDIVERQQSRETAERRNSGVTKRRKGGHRPAESKTVEQAE